jgi:hypothetical protein
MRQSGPNNGAGDRLGRGWATHVAYISALITRWVQVSATPPLFPTSKAAAAHVVPSDFPERKADRSDQGRQARRLIVERDTFGI